MISGLGLTRDGVVLFAGRALRTFGFGYLSVTLALYLARRGLSASAGFTTSARAMAQATTPLLAGIAMARAATGLPFFLAGGLKIVYDLALYFTFRRVSLPRETD